MALAARNPRLARRDGRSLVRFASLTAAGGRADGKGWPLVDDVLYDEPASSRVAPHPFDEEVLLGTHRTRRHGADAVVLMRRVGRDQACFDGADVVVESRLMDSEDPAANPNLAFTLRDTADAVRGLRAEGRTVLLHCAAAQQRTPSVAVEYGVLLGHEVGEVRRAVIGALHSTRENGLVWDAAGAGCRPITMRPDSLA